MATATIVRAWRDDAAAYMAVRVSESGQDTEYLGRVPLADLSGLTPAQQRAVLVAACKAERDRVQPPPATDLGLTGSVTL